MKKQIPYKWSYKGNIIRQLSQDKSSKLELIEGNSKEHVEELWKKYNERLLNMLKE